MSDVRTDFDRVFAAPTSVYIDDDGARIDVRIEPLGALDADEIAIGDPLCGSMVEVSPPSKPVRARGARIELAVARFSNGDERVAAARLVLGEQPIVRWAEADAAVEVDAGTAAIASARAIGPLVNEDAAELVHAALNATYRDTWSAARVELEHGAVCAFSSGFGDGVYPAYWGLDTAGEAVALALDFEVLTGSVHEELAMPRPRRRGRVDAPELAARGVTLRVPWLAPRWLVVSSRRMPADHTVYVRFQRPGATVRERLQHHFGSIGDRVFRIDLRAVPEDAQLIVRLVTGYRALTPVDPSVCPYR